MPRGRESRLPAWISPAVMLLVLAYGGWASSGLRADFERRRAMFFGPPERPARLWLITTVPLFAWWSIAVLTLELLPPRGRRSWQNPGVVPGVVVLMFMARNVVGSAVMSLRNRGIGPLGAWETVALALPEAHKLGWITHSVGVPVAAAWIAMIAFGWWRPARSWIESAGRLLGLYWIILGLIDPWHSSLV